MREIVRLGLVLMSYTLVAGGLLAFVYIKTAPVIESHKIAASGDSVRAGVLPGMEGGFEQQDKDSEFSYWTGFLDAGKKMPGGYVFIAYGKGYSSTIEAMVGVDNNCTITGVKILFQQETPGLGAKATETRPGESVPWFQKQFAGKSAADVKVDKDDGEIVSITGATITSRTVAQSIQKGFKELSENID